MISYQISHLHVGQKGIFISRPVHCYDCTRDRFYVMTSNQPMYYWLRCTTCLSFNFQIGNNSGDCYRYASVANVTLYCPQEESLLTNIELVYD